MKGRVIVRDDGVLRTYFDDSCITATFTASASYGHGMRWNSDGTFEEWWDINGKRCSKRAYQRAIKKQPGAAR